MGTEFWPLRVNDHRYYVLADGVGKFTLYIYRRQLGSHCFFSSVNTSANELLVHFPEALFPYVLELLYAVSH